MTFGHIYIVAFKEKTITSQRWKAPKKSLCRLYLPFVSSTVNLLLLIIQFSILGMKKNLKRTKKKESQGTSINFQSKTFQGKKKKHCLTRVTGIFKIQLCFAWFIMCMILVRNIILVLQKSKETKTRVDLNGNRINDKIPKWNSNPQSPGCSNHRTMARKFRAAWIVGPESCGLNPTCPITTAPQNSSIEQKLTYVQFIFFDNFFKVTLE